MEGTVGGVLAPFLWMHPVPQWVHQADSGRILGVSRSFAVLAGVAPKDLLESSVDAILVDAGGLVGTSLAFDGVLRFRSPWGSEVRARGTPIALGGRAAMLVVLEDASASRTAEAALRESERSFREMAENVPGALFRYMRRADGSDTVVYMSPRCEELWEVDAASIEHDATRLWEQVHPDDLPGMAASVMESAEVLTPWYWEWRITTPSGRKKWLQGSGRPARQSDGSVVWNTFILDVTERKQAELEETRLRQRLAQAEKLESLGRLSGGIAHDFNNFLTIILGYAEELLEEVADEEPLRTSAEEILSAGERCASLTRQLLAFARRLPGSGRATELSGHLVGIKGVLERLLTGDLTLEIEAPETPCFVTLEPAHADQVLTNLVANARDAMPRGGRILVRAFDGPASPGDAGSPVILEVVDEGEGMPDEVAARIFEPFFSTKHDGGSGTGLGLTTVLGLVEQAGGTLELQTAPGRGTTFRLSLPRAPEPDARPEPAARPAVDHPEPGGTLVVVDNDPQIGRFVGRVLEGAGFQVRVCHSGEEVLSLLTPASESGGDARVRAVISDVMMPGMKGPELVRRVRLQRPDLPILLMTGYTSSPGLLGTLAGSGVPVLHKPFRPSDLLEALRGVVAP